MRKGISMAHIRRIQDLIIIIMMGCTNLSKVMSRVLQAIQLHQTQALPLQKQRLLQVLLIIILHVNCNQCKYGSNVLHAMEVDNAIYVMAQELLCQEACVTCAMDEASVHIAQATAAITKYNTDDFYSLPRNILR